MPDPETLRELCLAHFRKAVTNPDSVPPWIEWRRDDKALLKALRKTLVEQPLSATVIGTGTGHNSGVRTTG